MSDHLISNDLRKVVNILIKDRNVWFNIGLQLNLEYAVIKEIENEKDNTRRLTAVISKWLCQIDPLPKWEGLVSALKAAGCESTASVVEKQYITSSEKQGTGEQSEETKSVLDEIDETLYYPPQDLIRAKNEIDDQFSDLIKKTLATLVQENKFTVDFLYKLFSCFSVSSHYREHRKFLDECILEMEENITPHKIWSKVCHYSHFMNYKLLLRIINNLSSPSLAKEMEQYEKNIKRFCEETSLHDFVKCFPEIYWQDVDLSNSSPHEFEIKVYDKLNKHKLSDLNRLEKTFATTFSLPDICGLILKRISEGCVLITWMIPTHYSKLLRQKLSICDEQFFESHDIQSVSLNKEVCYLKGSERTPINPAEDLVSNMTITKEMFELRDMMKKVMVSSPPFTVTQLCTAYVCKMLTQHLSNQNLKIYKFSDLPSDVHSKFLLLCQLAYERIVKSWEGETETPLNEDVHGLGLEGLHQIFIHKTLEEYLAAVHIINTVLDGIPEYIKEILPYFSRYLSFLPYFLFGLSKWSIVSCVYKELLIKFTHDDNILVLSETNFLPITEKVPITEKAVAFKLKMLKELSPTLSDLDNHVKENILKLLVATDSSPPTTTSMLSSRWFDSGYGSSSSSSKASSSSSLLGASSSFKSRLSSYKIEQFAAEYAGFVFGQLLFFCTGYYKLQYSQSLLKLQGLTRGLIAASESICNYEGLTLPPKDLHIHIEIVCSNSTSELFMQLPLSSRIRTIEYFSTGLETVPTFECAKYILEHGEVIEELTISKFDHLCIGNEVASALAEGLKMNKTLKKLNLNRNNIGHIGSSALAEALKLNTSLSTLNIVDNNIGHIGLSALAEALKLNASLSTLNIEYNNIGHVGSSTLAEALKLNNSLRTLNIEGNNIGDIGSSALAETLKLNTSLSILNIESNNIGDIGSSALAEALKLNTSLNTLNMEYNKIGDIGSCALAEALKLNTSLSTLNIGGNDIGDIGSSALAEALKLNTSLSTLDIGGNVGDIGSSTFAEALKSNTSLSTLNVAFNKIGDIGSSALAEALKLNTSLSTLNIKCNKIGDIGSHSLAEALKLNTSLSTLDIGGNDIGDSGSSALAEALKLNTSLSTLNTKYNPGTHALD